MKANAPLTSSSGSAQSGHQKTRRVQNGRDFRTGVTRHVLADEARESSLDIGYQIAFATDRLVSVEFTEDL